MRSALVVTTVHRPDDPRIALRTVGALVGDFDVIYAAQGRRPDLLAARAEFHPLRGGRFGRWWQALRLMLRRWDVVSVHDPELLPAAWLSRLRGNPVVFDLHENAPAQLLRRGPLGRVGSIVMRAALKLAGRTLHVTLAEDGYRGLVGGSPRVFPNHLPEASLPSIHPGDGSVVYVGDVTEVRGAMTLIEAVGRLDPSPPLVMIGRIPLTEFEIEMVGAAAERGVSLQLTGFMEWPSAMERASRGSVAVSPLHDIPNYRNSLPTKLIEYAALGVPAVASDLPGTREMAEGLPSVELVTPGSAEALAAAIGQVLAEPSRRAEAVQGADRIRGRYRWPAAEVGEFYLSVART